MVTRRVNLRIEGVVQGVFYRESTRARATQLGLLGRVRNTSDGAVELVAEGESEALEQLVQWCRRGPPSARVDALHRSEAPATGEFTDFQVER